MKFEVFTEAVKERVSSLCGPEYKVKLTETLKNNSVRLTGIMIIEPDTNITPTIYLEDFYTDYCDGTSIESIADRILTVYERNRCVGDVDVSLFGDFDKICERIIYRLVNYEKNAELLDKVPHRRFLDLAVIYSVALGETKVGYASVTVYNEHLSGWGQSEEDLWEYARRNTPRILEPELKPMTEMLSGIMGIECPVEAEQPEGAPVLYVLTNKRHVSGAACMLYDSLIGDFAKQKGKDLYILPSSVHELILFDADESFDPEQLTEMIREVNETQVGEQEILSYRLYRCFRETGRIGCMQGENI